jgi:hypothetical protein
MTVVCDYTMLNKQIINLKKIDPETGKPEVLVGSWKHPYRIGEIAQGATFDGPFKQTFNTRAMEHASAVLSLMVRGIRTDHPQNDKGEKGARVASSSSVTKGKEFTIGRLEPAPDERWRQEQFQIPTNILSSDGENTLVIGRVDLPGGGVAHDEFEVRDIVCFFKQSAG